MDCTNIDTGTSRRELVDARSHDATTQMLVRMRGRQVYRLGLVAAVAMVGLAASLTPLAADANTHTVSPPTLLRTIGGPEHAYIYPSGVEVAPNGDIVASDIGNNTIDEFTPSGTLVWQVGTFGAGVGQFDNPRDVGVDSSGNVYVADAGNNRVVKLDSNGSWVTSWGGGGGTTMSFPLGISVAGNKVYVADTGRMLIRVFDTSGNQLESFGSNGACIVGGLRDVDADSAGNIYVANYVNNDILKFTSTGTCITKWGTTGSGNGQFRAVYGVTLATDPVAKAAGDGTQEVFTADSQNNRMEEFTTSGTFIASAGIAGTPTQPGTLAYTRRVAVDANGNVWIADLWAWRLEKWTRNSTGTPYTYSGETIGTPLAPPTSSAVFQEVHQVAFETSGGVVDAIDAMDTVHHRLVRFSPTGTLLNTCGIRSEGTTVPGYNWPRGVAVDPATGQIWTLDTKAYRVEVLTPTCSAVAVFGSKGSGLPNFDWAYQIAIRGSDEVAWIADTWNNRIVSYNVATRQPIAVSAKGLFKKPAGIAIDPVNGNILVADSGNNRIVELSDTHGSNPTKVQTFYHGFNDPQGVAVDAAGNIYVADTNNNRVVVLSPSGTLLTTLTGGFNLPEAIALDPSGNIYVSDTFNDRIQVYGPLS